MTEQVKMYLDLAAVVIVAIFVGWFVHHERDIGRKEISDADQKVAAAAVQHNADLKNLTDQRTKAAADAYRAALATPVSHPVSVRVCKPAKASGSAPAKDVGTGLAVDAGSGSAAGVGQADRSVDIGPVTDEFLKNATAQLRACQSYVRSCQEAGICLR